MFAAEMGIMHSLFFFFNAMNANEEYDVNIKKHKWRSDVNRVYNAETRSQASAADRITIVGYSSTGWAGPNVQN